MSTPSWNWWVPIKTTPTTQTTIARRLQLFPAYSPVSSLVVDVYTADELSEKTFSQRLADVSRWATTTRLFFTSRALDAGVDENSWPSSTLDNSICCGDWPLGHYFGNFLWRKLIEEEFCVSEMGCGHCPNRIAFSSYSFSLKWTLLTIVSGKPDKARIFRFCMFCTAKTGIIALLACKSNAARTI